MYRRYPGTRPFRDNEIERTLFRGRDSEEQRLLHQTLAERLVVVFSKSGMGKSSLLNAGLFHRLRKRGFFPVTVRLNDPATPIIESIDAQLRQAAEELGVEFVGGKKETLWHYFKTVEFWSEKNMLLTPVLVFDQFEEIFALEFSQEQRQDFFTQLADLVNGHVPATVQQESGTRKHRETPPDGKVVLSLREDYLAHLEEINADIPSIFQNRFRLTALTTAQAKQAIVEPALVENTELSSGRFSYDSGAVDSILNFLQKKGHDITARRSFAGRGIWLWGLLGLWTALFAFASDPQYGTQAWGGNAVLLAIASILLTMYFPMRPVFAVLTTLLFQAFNLATLLIHYWADANTTDFAPVLTAIGPWILVTSILNAIVVGLIARSRADKQARRQPDDMTRQRAEIEPFQLQLICQHIEEQLMHRTDKGTATITVKDLGGVEGMQRILQDFYRTQLGRLGWMKRLAARKLFETGLISATGRRLSLDEEIITEKYRLSKEGLAELIASQLLRAESRMGGRSYEISHDTLVKPILDAAGERNRRIRVAIALTIAGVLVFQIGRDFSRKAEAVRGLTHAQQSLDSAATKISNDPTLSLSEQQQMLDMVKFMSSVLQSQSRILGVEPVVQKKQEDDQLPPPDPPTPAPPTPGYASIKSPEQDFITCKAIRSNQPVSPTNQFSSGAIHVWARVNAPRDEELVVQWYDASNNLVKKSVHSVRTSAETIVTSSLDEATVKKYPGRNEVRLYNSRNEVIGRRSFTVQPAASTSEEPPPPPRARVGGKIIDRETRGAIAGASATIAGRTERATTGRDGRFTIVNLPPGNYTVRVSADGYERKEQTEVVLTAGREAIIEDVILEPLYFPPERLEKVNPKYPPEADKQAGSRDSVLVEISVDDKGKVTDVKVLESTDPIFNSAALEAGRTTPYKAARKGNRTIPDKAHLRFRFWK